MKKARCTLKAEGVPIEDSVKRFAKAIETATQPQAISKYQSTLQAKLHDYLKENASRADVPISVEDVFSVDILDNDIVIKNSNQYLVDKYEYGYSDEKNIVTPRYYVRPSIEKFSKDLKNLIKDEINKEYGKLSSSYTNESWEY